MADFVFPQPEVGEFEAPNGLTYFHDGTKWVVKNIPAGDGDGVEYLPLTGGTIDGELHVNKPDGQPIFQVKADKVELQKHATSIEQLEPREIINVGILDNLMRDTGKYGYLKDYLPLSGGTQYKMKGILYLGGNKIAGVGDPELNTDAANRKYVDEQIAAIPEPEAGGGKFIDNFDHGYGVIQGSQSSPVPFNSVALLDDIGVSTVAFSNIGQVLMSKDQVNPEWLTKTGHIKVTDEGSDVLRGYLTVLDYMVLEGRNVSIKVMPGKYGTNTSAINTGQRLSLTFNGVFFGTYDPMWSPA